MRLTAIAFFIFVLAQVSAAELLNADFETLKSRLVDAATRDGSGATSTWSFTENGHAYHVTFEVAAQGHAILERNSSFIAVYYPDDAHGLLVTLYTREGNQPRLRAHGFGENPAQMLFGFKDISGWTKGTEHINGLELFFRDRHHLAEKWETLKPDGTKRYFEFDLIRKYR